MYLRFFSGCCLTHQLLEEEETLKAGHAEIVLP